MIWSPSPKDVPSPDAQLSALDMDISVVDSNTVRKLFGVNEGCSDRSNTPPLGALEEPSGAIPGGKNGEGLSYAEHGEFSLLVSGRGPKYIPPASLVSRLVPVLVFVVLTNRETQGGAAYVGASLVVLRVVALGAVLLVFPSVERLCLVLACVSPVHSLCPR